MFSFFLKKHIYYSLYNSFKQEKINLKLFENLRNL